MEKITYNKVSELKKNDLLLVEVDTLGNRECLCTYVNANVQIFYVKFLAGVSSKKKFDPTWLARSSYKNGDILFEKNLLLSELKNQTKVTKIDKHEAIRWIFLAGSKLREELKYTKE